MNKNYKLFLPYITMFLIILVVTFMFRQNTNSVTQVPISDFLNYLKDDKLVNVEMQENIIKAKTKSGSTISTYSPSFIMPYVANDIYEKIESGDLIVKGSQAQDRSMIFEGISILLTVFMIGTLFYTFKSIGSSNGPGQIFGIGKSKAHMYNSDTEIITFDDVAGLVEEKIELEEIVDFLKDADKYKKIGSRIPRGVLLEGPPGTGKTYLAKAVAGEAKVPFFSMSGSNFVEMFVGVGASRVRDLFAEAKKQSPCIIFIDEIDAVAKKRGNATGGGGNDEREQTLNQLLIEMDGFKTDTNIIVMAATNRSDVLDPALLRPGRFDRNIKVGIPDVVEREAMIKVHLKGKKYLKNVDTKLIAKATVGFTPADIANLINEAGILAIRDGKNAIDMLSIDKAMNKITVGIEKKTHMTNEKERRLTAYHEAGHAVVAKIAMPDENVHQVTIIPRGDAGGFTAHLPKEDRNYQSRNHLLGRMQTCMGGRLGEELVIGDISSGASNDLEVATNIARTMVTRFAMCDDMPKMVYIQNQFNTVDPIYSEKIRDKLDEKTAELLDDAYREAKKILEENMQSLHNIAEALLEFETINGREFEAAFTGGIEAVRKIREENDNKMGASFIYSDDQDFSKNPFEDEELELSNNNSQVEIKEEISDKDDLEEKILEVELFNDSNFQEIKEENSENIVNDEKTTDQILED